MKRYESAPRRIQFCTISCCSLDDIMITVIPSPCLCAWCVCAWVRGVCVPGCVVCACLCAWCVCACVRGVCVVCAWCVRACLVRGGVRACGLHAVSI